MEDNIRELAMRLVAEVSQSEALAYQRDSTIMLCPDGVAALVRAAVREGMMRAGSTVLQVGPKDGPTSLVTRGFYDAIRAEAAKLEGKP